MYLLMLISLFSMAYSVVDLLPLQGTVLNSSGSPITLGNIQVLIYDDATAGNLIYNSTTDFNSKIINGQYDILIGSGSVDLTLEYGKIYYMDILIDGEDIDFNGNERQMFQSSVGQIKKTSSIAISNGTNSFASGSGNALEINSVAIGVGAISSGQEAFALGEGVIASGFGSTAFGYNTNSSGAFSSSFGLETEATAGGAFSIGSLTKATGQRSFASGYQTVASGENSFAGGSNSQAIGLSSFAFGESSIASGDYSTATGYQTTASGQSSFAKGSSSNASGDYSIALGEHAKSTGSFSVALGAATTASGQSAVALGEDTLSSGDYSFTANKDNIANGSHSVAMGAVATANGLASFALGYNIEVNGNNSFGISLLSDGSSKEFVNQSNTFAVVGGNSGFGTTEPQRTVHINDVMRLEPRDTAPDNASLGDIYVDNRSKEPCFYTGNSWTGMIGEICGDNIINNNSDMYINNFRINGREGLFINDTYIGVSEIYEGNISEDNYALISNEEVYYNQTSYVNSKAFKIITLIGPPTSSLTYGFIIIDFISSTEENIQDGNTLFLAEGTNSTYNVASINHTIQVHAISYNGGVPTEKALLTIDSVTQSIDVGETLTYGSYDWTLNNVTKNKGNLGMEYINITRN